MLSWSCVQKISQRERNKTYKGVLEIFEKERFLVEAIRVRRYDLVRHALRHLEEWHNTVMQLKER